MKRIHSHTHKIGKIRLFLFFVILILAPFNKCQKCRLFDEPEQLEKKTQINQYLFHRSHARSNEETNYLTSIEGHILPIYTQQMQ